MFSWAKRRQRKHGTARFLPGQAVPQPPLPAESDAPRQRLPPTRRHAAGFGIVHLWNEWHSASAAGRHNRALVPVRARWCPPWDACAVRRVMNERRVQRQFCAKPAPTRSQAVDGVHVENKSAQSEQRARTWSPRLQQLRLGGVRAPLGCCGERRAPHRTRILPR